MRDGHCLDVAYAWLFCSSVGPARISAFPRTNTGPPAPLRRRDEVARAVAPRGARTDARLFSAIRGTSRLYGRPR